MDSSRLLDLINRWSDTYFSKPILFICVCISLYYGIKYCRKDKGYLLFVLYSFLYLVTIMVTETLSILLVQNGRLSAVIFEIINTIIAAIEVVIFYRFYSIVIMSRPIKYIMGIGLVPLFVLIIIFFFKALNLNSSKAEITNSSILVNIVEFFLIIIPCLTYFYEIFKKDVNQIKIESSTFWVTAGIFIYCISTLPFLIISENLLLYNKGLYFLMFTVHYLSLCFLFLSLSRAFQCKTSTTI